MNNFIKIPDNPDRVFIEHFIKEELSHVPITNFPLATKFGMTLETASVGSVALSFSVDESFTQGGQVIQGGIVATLLDFGLGYAAMSTLPAQKSIATASLNIDYLRAAPAGNYRVEAKVIKKGKSVIFAKADLLTTQGNIVATASSPLMVINLMG